jgi:hypothetical protein
MNKLSRRIVFPTVIVLCAAIAFAQAKGHFYKSEQVASLSKEETDLDNQRRTADDPWAELGHLFSGTQQARSIAYAGKMKLTDEEGTETIEEADFSGEVHGEDSHYFIDSVEFIHQDNVSLNVYHREKLVVAGTEKLPFNSMWQFANMDSVKSFAAREGAMAEVVWDKADKIIKISNNTSTDVYSYEIYYNPQSYRLKKLVLHYATLDNLDNDTEVEAEGDLRETSAYEEEKVTVDEDSTHSRPSIEFNLYKLEFEFRLLRVGEGANKFAPLKKIGQKKGSEFHLNNAYYDYRLVWLGGPEKEKE